MKSASVLILTILTFAGAASAASLALGEGTAIPGWVPSYVPVSMVPAGGETIAALQFDVVFDPAAVAYGHVDAGSAATAAGKSVDATLLEPGRLRVVIAGLNLTAIDAGLVAGVYLSLATTAGAGPHMLSLENIVLANPLGVAVASTATNGALVGDLQELPAADGVLQMGLVAFLALLGVCTPAWGRRRA
jgi:hypothetical protein